MRREFELLGHFSADASGQQMAIVRNLPTLSSRWALVNYADEPKLVWVGKRYPHATGRDLQILVVWAKKKSMGQVTSHTLASIKRTTEKIYPRCRLTIPIKPTKVSKPSAPGSGTTEIEILATTSLLERELEIVVPAAV